MVTWKVANNIAEQTKANKANHVDPKLSPVFMLRYRLYHKNRAEFGSSVCGVRLKIEVSVDE
jgi:hypothetical protein